MPAREPDGLEERIARLEQRLRHAEDILEISRLIASYGPAADAGDRDAVAAIWADDGRYEVPGFDIPPGRAGLRDLMSSDFHQTLIAAGSAHLLSPHDVRVEGDLATATGYALVVVPVVSGSPDAGFRVFRSVATRWEFERRADAWECVRRINGLLDGRAESRDLLGGAGG